MMTADSIITKWGWYSMANVKIKRNMPAILAKVQAGNKAMVAAVTEAVVQYGNKFVREDQGVLRASALIGTAVQDAVNRSDWTPEDKATYSAASGSRPKEGLAIWDTPYAKRVYYTGTPSTDQNPDAAQQWAEKGVCTYKKELDQVAQNAFTKGMKS